MESEYLLEIVDRIRNNSLDVVFALEKSIFPWKS